MTVDLTTKMREKNKQKVVSSEQSDFETISYDVSLFRLRLNPCLTLNYQSCNCLIKPKVSFSTTDLIWLKLICFFSTHPFFKSYSNFAIYAARKNHVVCIRHVIRHEPHCPSMRSERGLMSGVGGSEGFPPYRLLHRH